MKLFQLSDICFTDSINFHPRYTVTYSTATGAKKGWSLNENLLSPVNF